ncbi:hypothetical protein [Runella sp.]|jgi:hypothetical protein|uniref:hypothetical protein n=1 Tax=Runella sp. TaxID=1960881 RepID=UPI003018B9BC
MKNLFLIGLVALIEVQCKSTSQDALLSPQGCASEKPTLIGPWAMTEFRYYGGCCPVIVDSTWKKATDNSYFVEFTSDGKLKVTDNTPGVSNGLIAATPAHLVTDYTFDGKEITLNEQILGGSLAYKKVGVSKLTTTELVLTILVGKEGETNARKFIRSCQ